MTPAARRIGASLPTCSTQFTRLSRSPVTTITTEISAKLACDFGGQHTAVQLVTCIPPGNTFTQLAQTNPFSRRYPIIWASVPHNVSATAIPSGVLAARQ